MDETYLSAMGQPSPHAEQLRQVMGWERLPEQRVRYDADEAAAVEAARSYYGAAAAV
jgi:hypothetical protein